MTLLTVYGLCQSYHHDDRDRVFSDQFDSIFRAYKVWAEVQSGIKNGDSYQYGENDPQIMRDPCMCVCRAPGYTCISELVNFGHPASRAGPRNDSKGCGGIMRIAPVPFMDICNGFTSEETMVHAADIAAMTHGHPLGFIPAGVAASMIYHLAEGKSLNDSLSDAIDESLKIFGEYSDLSYSIDLLRKAMDLVSSPLSDEEAISRLGEGWVAEETLAMSVLSCLRYPNDPLSALRMAVNIDGDSDSVGAVAGNIIGCSLGYVRVREFFRLFDVSCGYAELSYCPLFS